MEIPVSRGWFLRCVHLLVKIGWQFKRGKCCVELDCLCTLSGLCTCICHYHLGLVCVVGTLLSSFTAEYYVRCFHYYISNSWRVSKIFPLALKMSTLCCAILRLIKLSHTHIRGIFIELCQELLCRSFV